jgi:hypothetical protein
VKVTAYVPTTSYTKTLPEYVEIYATPERALRAGEILWRRGRALPGEGGSHAGAALQPPLREIREGVLPPG